MGITSCFHNVWTRYTEPRAGCSAPGEDPSQGEREEAIETRQGSYRNFGGSSAEVERSTHVTISYDRSEMPGIKNMVWKIYNDTNPNFDDIYYDNMWLTYVFKNPGAYRIALEVEDTNGNINSTEKNMIFVK